jgi:hypothetical protein
MECHRWNTYEQLNSAGQKLLRINMDETVVSAPIRSTGASHCGWRRRSSITLMRRQVCSSSVPVSPAPPWFATTPAYSRCYCRGTFCGGFYNRNRRPLWVSGSTEIRGCWLNAEGLNSCLSGCNFAEVDCSRSLCLRVVSIAFQGFLLAGFVVC